MSSPIRDILQKHGLEKGFHLLTYHPDKTNTLSDKDTLTQAEEALLQYFEGLLGDYDKYNDMCDNCSDWDEGRNDLRDKVKRKLRGGE